MHTILLVPAPTKPNTFRLYLPEAETALMREICQRTEMGQSELMSKLMTASLRAVAENGYRFTVPLRLRISDSVEDQERTPRNRFHR